MIDFNHIYYFTVTCRRKNITSAAHELHISQQSLSKCIKNLENTFGRTLFVRSKKGVFLTEDGRYLYDKLSPAVDKYISAQDEVYDTICGSEPQKLTVANSAHLFGLFFPNIPTLFKDSYPNIELELNDMPDEEILNYVLSDSKHLGLIAAPYYWKHSRVREYVIKTFDLMLCLNKKNPLAKKKSVSFGDLKGEEFLIFDNQSISKDMILYKSEEYGFDADISYRTTDIYQLFSMADNGKGIIICTPTKIHRMYKNLCYVPFHDKDMTLKVAFVFQEYDSLNETEKRFMDFMKKKAGGRSRQTR